MEYDTTMAQGDQRNCDGGGCGLGRSSKRPKQKKVPQRGLGVAQLEKIRLEEQQKRDAATTVLPSPSSSSLTKPSYLSLPINNFDHSNQQSSTSPLPCGPPSDFRSLQQQQQQQQQHMDGKAPSTVPLANSAGFEAGNKNPPKWWSSYEIDFKKDNFGVDHGLPFLPSLPLTNWVQRTPQYQHQTCSSMVNVSSGTSLTPVPHFSLEPPSNQNFSGSCVPVRPVEKMVGMKRPYPFSLDFPHAPAFNYKLPAFTEIRTNAKAPCNNGSGYDFDAGNSTSREASSCSGSNSEPNSKKRNKENENFKGDFLSLGPPTPTSCPPSKFKTFSTFLAFHNQGYPEFESLPYQGNVENQSPTPPLYRLFNQQKQPLYCVFIPEAKEEQIGQTTGRIQNCHEVGESIDLDLKL